MSDESTNRTEAVYNGAVKLTPSQRPAWLDQACAGDVELRHRVEELLLLHDPKPPPPAGSPDKTIVLSFPGFELPIEKPGQMIGRYKLLQILGEGGMGVVWMAEQEQPVRRRVALKIIKLGMDTKQIIARFEAERQALALMNHPNIAKVLDGGATETGRPYFVMELVQGVKITEYCDLHNLATRERLDLFIQSCRAIQHAHQKGIIHRDIKPSNLLVAMHDGIPTPKVIDFGIAKATAGQRLTDKTLVTEVEQLIGTPAYMSPEQAEMSGLDIDTRSDIYSLGVLLYELLTGQTPFDAKELHAGGLDNIRSTIREKEPPRPSTRLVTMLNVEGSKVAKNHHTEIHKLVQLLQGDLDWIVMKCLEKDRIRRYDTANALADDLLRHLNYETVLARPPSTIYRLNRTVRRHKLAFAFAVIVTLLLLVGAAVSTWQAHVQSQLRQKAEKAEASAWLEADKSQAVAQFLEDMLMGVGPSAAKGRDTVMLREILDHTAQRVGTDLKDQPEVEATLRNTMGNVYAALASYGQAESMYRRTLEIYRNLRDQQHQAIALNNLANVLRTQGKFTEAVASYRQAVALQTAALGQKHPDIATTLDGLAAVLREQGDLTGAEAQIRQALAMREELLGPDQPEVASSLTGLAAILRDQGKFNEAETLFQKTLDLRKKLLGDDHPEVANAWDNLAATFLYEGKLPEAETAFRQALAIYHKLFGNENPLIATALNDLAIALQNQNRLSEAESTCRESLAMRQKLLGQEHPAVAESLNTLATIFRDQGKLTESEQLYREALSLRKKLLGDEHPDVATSLSNLALVLQVANRWAEAASFYRQCLAIREKKLPDNWQTFNTRSRLGGCLLQQKEFKEAEPLLLSGYEGMAQRRTAIPAASRVFLQEAGQRIIQLYDTTDRHPEAILWSKKI